MVFFSRLKTIVSEFVTSLASCVKLRKNTPFRLKSIPNQWLLIAVLSAFLVTIYSLFQKIIIMRALLLTTDEGNYLCLIQNETKPVTHCFHLFSERSTSHTWPDLTRDLSSLRNQIIRNSNKNYFRYWDSILWDFWPLIHISGVW